MATTKQRRICVICGCKRVVDQMKPIGIKHGRYFQADKEITGYACTRKQYISERSCFEKYEEEAKKWGSPYHDPVRVGKGSKRSDTKDKLSPCCKAAVGSNAYANGTDYFCTQCYDLLHKSGSEFTKTKKLM